MRSVMSVEEVEAKRISWLDGLYKAWIGGNEEAGNELSLIALGGYPYARELIRKREGTSQQAELISRPQAEHE